MGETEKIKILLDTDVLINLVDPENEHYSAILEFLYTFQPTENFLYISSITELEFIQGNKPNFEKDKLKIVAESFTTVYVNKEIGKLARELIYTYSSSHGLLLADSLIAATALAENYTLLTFNKRHFQFIRKLKLYSLVKK